MEIENSEKKSTNLEKNKKEQLVTALNIDFKHSEERVQLLEKKEAFIENGILQSLTNQEAKSLLDKALDNNHPDIAIAILKTGKIKNVRIDKILENESKAVELISKTYANIYSETKEEKIPQYNAEILNYRYNQIKDNTNANRNELQMLKAFVKQNSNLATIGVLKNFERLNSHIFEPEVINIIKGFEKSTCSPRK
jgi:hypothetical protein